MELHEYSVCKGFVELTKDLCKVDVGRSHIGMLITKVFPPDRKRLVVHLHGLFVHPAIVKELPQATDLFNCLGPLAADVDEGLKQRVQDSLICNNFVFNESQNFDLVFFSSGLCILPPLSGGIPAPPTPLSALVPPRDPGPGAWGVKRPREPTSCPPRRGRCWAQQW